MAPPVLDSDSSVLIGNMGMSRGTKTRCRLQIPWLLNWCLAEAEGTTASSRPRHPRIKSSSEKTRRVWTLLPEH